MNGQNKHDANICPLCGSPLPKQDETRLRSTKAILACLDHFRDKRQEYFVCLSLDSGQRLIARRVVTVGLLDATLVHPREVFAGPLADRAASVVVAHNHPSGDAEPSRADIKTTQQLVAAGILLGITLQDHIIVAAKSHYSFRRSGLL